MAADNIDSTTKSFLRGLYLTGQASHPLHVTSLHYNIPSSSVPNSDKSGANLNVSVDRLVSRQTHEPPATSAARTNSPVKHSVRSDAWCEATTVEHQQAKPSPEVKESSAEENQKMLSQAYSKTFFIGLSSGLVLSVLHSYSQHTIHLSSFYIYLLCSSVCYPGTYVPNVTLGPGRLFLYI